MCTAFHSTHTYLLCCSLKPGIFVHKIFSLVPSKNLSPAKTETRVYFSILEESPFGMKIRVLRIAFNVCNLLRSHAIVGGL